MKEFYGYDPEEIFVYSKADLERVKRDFTEATGMMVMLQVYLLGVEVELAKPAIREVQLNFRSEPALRPNAIAIADDEHPDHQLGINGRAADIAVEGMRSSRRNS